MLVMCGNVCVIKNFRDCKDSGLKNITARVKTREATLTTALHFVTSNLGMDFEDVFFDP